MTFYDVMHALRNFVMSDIYDSSGQKVNNVIYNRAMYLGYFRLQLEERLAQEARERKLTEDKKDDKKLSTEELRVKVYNDVRKSPVDDRRRAEQVHFVLGGDK